DRKNRGALFENFGRAVDTALAFGIEHKHAAVLQTEGTGTHSRDEIHVGINDYDAQPTRQDTHETRAKNFAGPDREGVTENRPRQKRSEDDRVKEALVIRTKNVRTLGRKFFQPAYLQGKAIIRDHLHEAADCVPKMFGNRPGSN